MAPTHLQWIEQFSRAAGVTAPTEDEVQRILDLAGVAAHASERPAAPVTCWIAASAGLTPSDAFALAQRVATELEGDPHSRGTS
jgi:hypothetical protein